MNTTETCRRVLIVSTHPILAKALVQVTQEAGCQVIGTVADVPQALRLLPPHEGATVIVDYAGTQPREAEWLPLLQQTDSARRVILLTLTSNEMIVHEQRRVNFVTSTDLQLALGT
ncbi:MAG: hypothetical protein HY782_24875 [Chloroflexi bacterium]|nr:hypothetical protein [Chloroflexota bacterium]